MISSIEPSVRWLTCSASSSRASCRPAESAAACESCGPPISLVDPSRVFTHRLFRMNVWITGRCCMTALRDDVARLSLPGPANSQTSTPAARHGGARPSGLWPGPIGVRFGGQRWRSVSDCRVLTTAAPAHASGWFTRLEGNEEVLMTVDETDLLGLYERSPQRLDVI